MKVFLLGILNILCVAANNKIIELDSSFSTLINDGPWLVKFYAPWCGYCRKLEPIYEELALKSLDLPIKIARLDATRYPEVASMYQVRGYPTIKYINGSDVHTHEGDRTVNHFLRFIRRAVGLSVKHLPSIGRFQEALDQQQSEPFFIYIGPRESYLRFVFGDVANSLRLSTYFFSSHNNFIPEEFVKSIDLTPTLQDVNNGTVISWKEDSKLTFHYKESIENLNDSLKNWVMVNRFLTFPKVSHQDLWELEILHKPIVIFLLNSSDVPVSHLKDLDSGQKETSSTSLISLAQKIVSNSEEYNVNDVQFVWSTDSSSMSDLAMTTLMTPNILIFEPSNSTIYLLPEYTNHRKLQSIKIEDILEFLNSFRAGQIKGYGGTGFSAKLHRAGYDFVTGLIEFISTTPLLAMFIIGIPLSVISFLCYAICCMDSGESDMRRSETRSQKKIRKPLYETPLRSSEELNIKSELDKKID